jgi:hypothetical protein
LFVFLYLVAPATRKRFIKNIGRLGNMAKAGEIEKYLIEWGEHYFRSRDSFHKNIVSMSHKKGILEIEFKDRKEKVMVAPDLGRLTEQLGEGISIITLNNRKNVECLYTGWSRFSKVKGLKIYFINPLSTTEKKWIVNPSVHSKICDEASLKTGLMAMFETVEPITVEILEKKL